MKVLITPDVASDYLKKNINNRPLSKHHIDQIVRAIKNNEWIYNGESIKFDTLGNLLDGQHRLHAIISANIPVESEVIFELSPTIFKTLDQTKKRNLSDFIAISGAEWWVEKSALTRHLFFYRTMSYETKKVLYSTHTSSQLFDFYIQNKAEIDDTIMHCRHLKRNGMIIQFSKIVFIYNVFSKIDLNNANKFLNDLLTGYNLVTGSPIAALRETQIKEKMYNQFRISNIIAIDLLFRTWNLYRANTFVKLNAIKPNYKIEKLPELV